MSEAVNDIVKGPLKPRVAENEEGCGDVLHTGDLVYLERSPDESGSSGGVVHGDTNLRQLGVATPSRNGINGSWRFNECVFRVCIRLIYFAKNELKHLELLREKREEAKDEMLEAGIAPTAAMLRDDDRFMSDLQLARERAEIEKVQNDHALLALDEGKTESVKYGDVIQLQHLPSGLFVTLQHTAATVDTHCRKVTLEPEGSFLAKFRILPRYRGQTIGSPVTAGSGIILQNVEVSSLTLAVGSGPNTSRPPAYFIRAQPRPDIGTRLPHVLKHGAIVELNASIERRGGFTVRLFKHHSHSPGGDESHRNSMYTSLHKFRLFHPESEASVLASTNTDKGEVLDCFESEEEGDVVATLSRNDGTPAHIPYVKLIKTGLAQSGEDDGDIKGVWSFELINRSTSGPVMWRSPLRIRHVTSGKYLSVNSKTQANFQASDRSSAGADSTSEVMEFFDVALVTDVDLNAEPGTFGSPESLVFSIVPQNAQPHPSVPNAISAVVIEHLPPWGEESRALHFFVSSESKPQFTSKPKEVVTEEDRWNGSIGPKRKHGLRILFCTHRSPGDALRVYPLGKGESVQLDQILSQIPLLKLYAYLYQSEETLSKCVDLAEPLCASLLRLLGSLHKKDDGEVWSPLLAAKSTLEYMKNANSRQYLDLRASYMGEQTSDIQVLIFQTKLLNCIFEATLAPYNRCLQNMRAFNDRVASDLPRALQIVLNISLQCASHGNERVHKYFSTCTSRAWFAITPEDSNLVELARSDVPENFRSRCFQPWHDLLVHMCEDELGSANILTDLIRSSETFSSKVYSRNFIGFIKVSIGRFGPQRRLLDIISALCYIDGLPSVERQEMCIREIISDPHAFGFSFHENKEVAPDYEVGKFGTRARLEPGVLVRAGVEANFQVGGNRFLGDTETNTYAPVCIAWSSQQNWTRGCGKLWWSPEYLGLPVVDCIEVNDIEDNEYTRSMGLEGTAGMFGLVPIEHLLWPLDPEVLCPRVLGKQFQPEEFGFGKTEFKDLKTKKRPFLRQHSNFSGSFNIKKDSNYMYTAGKDVVNIRKRFEAHFTLAEFMVAQMNLMATLCESRSSLNFFHTEKFFSYDILMNMATNDLLPSVFRSSVLRLINVLYLDRYPQLPASGASHFPEELWVFAEDEYSGPRKSTIPIIKKMVQGQNGTLPKFDLSPLSISYNSPNPVESHPNDRKFLLLANLCEELISLSTSNGVIHSDIRLNTLALVALQNQSCLLDFGFMGTFQKLKQAAHTCASILDGRMDMMLPGIPFESHEQRYQLGTTSKVPNDMKKCVIETLLHIVDVRTNIRLGKLLYLFKEKAIAHAQHNTALDLEARAVKSSAMVSSNDHGSAMKYLTGVRSQELFDDFDALFTTGEAAELDLANLANMKNLDHVIMDCLMNHDDDLLASGLHLLFSTYGQRRQLSRSLADVVLLTSPALPVFDDVHTLLTEAQDLQSLLQSFSVWGVKSVISGPFGDAEFAEAMLTVERMLLFLHDFDTFKARIRMQPYSILGTRMGLDKKVIEGAGPDPGDVPGCAIVDPAGLKYIQPFGGGPCKVSGASKSIHKWIGTDKDSSFHPDIIQAIKKPGDAKHQTYHRPRGQSDVHVIHAVGPDFRRKHEPGMPAYTRDEGVELLCQAYHSILVEFVESGQNVLRLTPVSGGAQAGPFVKEIAPLAEEGMRGGFARLTASQQAHVLEKELHLCIFAEKELKAFYNAGFIPSPEAAKLIGVNEDTEPHSSGSTGKKHTKAKHPEHYQGSFTSTDIDGNKYKCTGLWSLDVASKWANTLARLPVMGKFQDILRAFNVQGIITDTLLGKQRMDPRIAWKGSVCTEKERVESERRLVMLNSALLSLAIKFVTENRENQRILALSFHDLQNLAAGKVSSIDNSADKVINKFKLSQSLNASDKGITGNKTISELAQELILAILRGNEPLVESYVGPELLHLFANLVNQSADVSASRAIDLFFVLAKPETQPLKDQQTAIVREILGSGSFSPFVNGLRRCLRQVTGGAEWEDAFGGGDLSTIPLQNPARLVQLVFALIEGGNGDAWLELATHAGVTLDDACDATVKFIEKFLSKAGYDGPSRPPPPLDHSVESKEGPAETWDPVTAAENDIKAKNSAVSQLLESGTGKVLCDLLAEAVLLVPHTKVTLRSKSLWRFIEEASVPIVSHFISKEHPTALEIGLVTGMIEILQQVLSELVLAGLLEDAIIDHAHAITLLGMACKGIMEGRTSFYEELRSKFSETIKNREGTRLVQSFSIQVRSDRAISEPVRRRSFTPHTRKAKKTAGILLDGGLSRKEFRSIMNILAHQVGTDSDEDFVTQPRHSGMPNMPHLFRQGALPGINYFDEAKIGEAFDAADRDKDDSIGHEEFIRLFELVIEGALSFGGARVHNYHRISKRSVECVERINYICAKDYANLKDLKEPRARTGDDGSTGGVEDNGDEGDIFNNRKKSGEIKFNFRKRTKKKNAGLQLSSNLEDQFTAFKKAVRVNTQLKSKIDERRFSMVSVLENGAPLLGSVDGKPGNGKHPIALGVTPPRPGSKEAKKLMFEASLQISWEDLTSRLVKYAKGHFKDEGIGADTCGFIFSVWAYHLMKAHDELRKVSAAGVASDPKKLARAKQAYEDKQESLDDSGVTDLLAKIIITLPAGEVGSVQDKAVNLFSELLKGGNQQIQRSLYSYLDKKDTEGNFLPHLFERLDHSFVGLKGCKERGLLGLNMTPESAEYVENADQILEFLQLLCENHNPEFQNLLREQPQAAMQVNLVQKAVDFLNLLVDSTATVVDFSPSEHRLASQILAFLTECMEGPCPRNQVRITTVEVINSVNAILSVNPNQKMEFASAGSVEASSAGKARALADMVSVAGEDDDAPADLRASACVMLAACLEGRHDTLTHDSIRRRIDQRMLGRYRCELEEGIWATVLAAEVEYRLLDKAEEEVVASMQTALAALATVASELHLALPVENAKDVAENEKELSNKNKPLGEDEKEEILGAQRGRHGMWGSDMVAGAMVAVAQVVEVVNVNGGSSNRYDNGDEDGYEDETSSSDEEGAPSGSVSGVGGSGGKVGGEGGIGSGLLGTCEIAWQGKIERTVFPLPIEFKYLAPQTKEDFMKKVPLDTADTRMTELIKQSAVFEAEMRLVHKKSVESRVYQFLTNYLSEIKSLMYLFVILLNLNVIMSPATLSSPFEALGRHNGWFQYDNDDGQWKNGLNPLEVYSLLLTIALGVANFTGYFFIMNHVGRTEVPILIKEYEENVRQNRLALKPSQWINLRPFKTWVAALVFNIMFCIIHSANFKAIPELYMFAFCFVTLPWTLVATRKSIKVPCGRLKDLQRVYCLAYDTILRRPFFRNHVILQCFSILGFYRSQFFTLMLLDVVNINPTLAGIIKSITAPGFSLIMVFYLFTVTVIIYASFGQESFGKYLLVPGYDDESGESNESPCTSTLSCLYAIFYSQLAGPLGELNEQLRTVDSQSGDYYSRIIYDSVFFIWVGLVLTNIITGLMVDTFSAIRNEEAARLEVLETVCFVCGVTRSEYDDFDLGKKRATFKQHQVEDHNPWIYVAYLVYLRQKDETEHNGIETYVESSVEQRSMDWIPNGTSAAIEAHKKEAAARAARRQLILQAYGDDDDDDDDENKNGLVAHRNEAERGGGAGGAAGANSSTAVEALLHAMTEMVAKSTAQQRAVGDLKEQQRVQLSVLQDGVAELLKRSTGGTAAAAAASLTSAAPLEETGEVLERGASRIKSSRSTVLDRTQSQSSSFGYK